MLYRRLSFILTFTLLCLLAASSAWAITPAGTRILTQAEASFYDTETGTPERLISNQSWVDVGIVADFILEYDQTQYGTAGQQVYFIHWLINQGNIADSYRLRLPPTRDNSLKNQGVYEYNGALPAPGTPSLTETRILQPGEAIQLVVMATIPVESAEGDINTLRLVAQSKQDLTVQEESKNTVITGEVAVRLGKTVNKLSAAPGDQLQYSIQLQNIGNKPVPPGEIEIDGETFFTGALLEDILPPQTTPDYSVAPVFSPAQSIVVLRTETGDWHTLENWNQQDEPTRIGLLIPSEQLKPGQSGLLSFAVTINSNTKEGTQITNSARLYNDLEPGAIEYATPLATSNPVYTTVVANDDIEYPEPSIRFVEPASLVNPPDFNGSYHLAGYYFLNPDDEETVNDVYLELEGGNFNRSKEVADIININPEDNISPVLLRSGTGDQVQIILQETGVNTGVFRSQSPLRLTRDNDRSGTLCEAKSGQPDYTTHGNSCFLQTISNDTLTASVVDPITQKTFTATASVSPQGQVFSTETLDGIDGATVLFTDLLGNPVSQTRSSGANGEFVYPRLEPGRYFINVTPPENFQFPSKVPPDNLPGHTLSEASYGPDGYPEPILQRRSLRGGVNIRGAFTVNDQKQIERFDIPVDPMATSTLVLTKEAKQTEVAPGELVSYQLTLTNNTDTALYNPKVVDYLPVGFKYLEGSTRINDQPAADPAGANSSILTFTAPVGLPIPDDANASSPITITYTLQARAGAIDSDGINRARASAKRDGTGIPVTSNEAKARVTVKMTGVLSDKAILFGKLYLDSQCTGETGNGIQNPNDWPIGGVRLYMEDGTWVITDENGQYSLMGLNPGTHVIRVDPFTLPDGLELKPLDNRNAADGNSRFVDLTNGELHRADFAAMCPETNGQAIFDQIKERNKSINGDWLLDDAAQYNRSKPSETADSNGDLSNGVIRAPDTNRQKETETATRKPQTADSGQQQAGSAQRPADSEQRAAGSGQREASMPLAKEAIKTVTNAQAVKGTFLWPLNKPGETAMADGRFMAVVRAGVEPKLYINNQEVAHDRLGEQLLNNREQAQLLAWYGVSLKEGNNRVEVKAKDMFGNERLLAGGDFIMAGSAKTLKVEPAAKTLQADGGRSLLPVTVSLLDKQGMPARGIYFITLESSAGQWQETDIQDREPGHQIRVDQGTATVHLRSGLETGEVTLRASNGELQGEATINQIAPSRPLMAVGLIELNTGKLPELLVNDTDNRDTRSRAALFAKGDIAEDTSLTLSYDSEKEDNTELFRDVDPEDYYPITGDASQKGYEAQSRSKLYAKIEKGLSSIMWGDYQTDSQGSENNLAKLQRNLNGVNGIYDNGQTKVQGFAARPENNLLEEEIEPNGTAMNYRLKNAPIIRHSETVVLEVWDRNSPGLMLSSTTLNRGSDYTLDEFSGYLKFSEPVNSRDEEGNPQRIRVSYEVEGDGEAYTVAGARVEHQLNDKVKVGVSYTHDGHESEGQDLSGAWIEVQPADKTTIAIAAAQMTGKTAEEGGQVTENSGNAARIKVKHQWNSNSETELTWGRASEHFTNSAGGVSAGREETRLQHKQQLTDNLGLRAEAEISRSTDDSNAQGNSAGVYLDKKLGDGWQLTAGSRYIQQGSDQEKNDPAYTTAMAGVKKSFKLLGREASVAAEYEQALGEARWRGQLESDWKVHDKISIYGRLERDNNLDPLASGSDQNEFSFGVKSDWLEHTETYSEYRMRGASDGDTLEWVNGADTTLELSKGLSITPSIEWINTLRGDASNDGLALSMGVQDKRHSNQRATGRVEYRHGVDQDYYGFDGALARRLNLDWSGLVREEFRIELPRNDDGSRTINHALTLGLASRPKRDNTQHGLYLYQWKEEDGENEEENRRVHLFSTHQNRQLRPGLVLSGRFGTKWETTSFNSDDFTSRASVFDSRLTWDLNRRWDLDIRAGVLAVDGTDSLRWSAGLGLNYLVMRNLRVGGYYNAVGFTDKDLDSEKYNAEGFHLTLQFKFDESLFDWFRS